MATTSFWEGVDVPGEALQLVVIDRIPFAVPSDPLVAARCEALAAEGRAAFAHYMLPMAAMTLKQGFGRLLRTRRDRGVVAVFDGRLHSKHYRHMLLASLPPAPVCHTLEELTEFWQQQTNAIA